MNPVETAKELGTTHGTAACVKWLFRGVTDPDTVMAVVDAITSDETSPLIAWLPQPGVNGYKYSPTQLLIDSGAYGMSVETYADYTAICDAYDEAFSEAVMKHIHTVGLAFREARES